MAWTDSLIAYWKLEEASGTRYDAHNSHDLTAYNSPGNAPGKQGNAVDLEYDSTQYLAMLSHSDFQVGGDVDFAVAGWVKYETVINHYPFAKYLSGGSPQREYFVGYYTADSRFKFYVRDSTDSNWAIAVADNFGAASTDTWYWIFCYHDKTANEIGIKINNGTADTAALSGGGYSGTARVVLGGRDDSQGFDGLMDEWCFWKGGFPSAAEQTEMYNSGAGVTYPSAHVPWSPLRWWINRRRSGLLVPQLRLRPMPV